MIKAIIFDMDGVISDTLSIHTQSESMVFSNYDIQITPGEILKRFNGVPDKVMNEEVFAENGKIPNANKLAEEKLQEFEILAKQKLKEIPGARDLIKTLKENGFFLGVASSAQTEIIDLILTGLHLKQFFNAITSTVEVEHGKPSPDIFLLTAKKLGVNPKNCVVVEDAHRGIEAAKNAGMLCIAITTTEKKEELSRADKIIDSLSEITLSLLKKI